ncbi:MAG TPA: LapD/MoxY N-terminal periplasmic domain-containing protein, partial [Methylophilaceae bacterium]|nr:LapD/MoxY N-terminal periplasmic domain-containing protein [Methylophilaceae bacterium]
MSIIKQLWLAIVIMMILAFGGSFVVSTLSSKHYLEQQLQMKNIDNAASLALSLSRMQKEPVDIDLMLAAQFDTGHYQYIGLTSPAGEVMSEHKTQPLQGQAPAWFTRTFPMQVQPGIAQVQDGWAQYGTLKLESQSRFAYSQLWNGAKLALLWSLAVGLMTGYLGSLALRSILRPLKDVVQQAEAIGERRFIRIAEPKTMEFKQLVVAMNSLSDRIKNMLQEESARLERLRQQANYDAVSGLMNRSYFFSRVNTLIANEDSFSKGALVVTNLSNLALIDQKLGHHETNALIKTMGDALTELCKQEPSLMAGRLAGTDFAVFSALPVDGYALANNIKGLLTRAAELPDGLPSLCLPTVSCPVTKDIEHIQDIVKLISVVMVGISPDKADMLHVMQQENVAELQNQDELEWRVLLTSALADNRLKLALFPVVDQKNQLIHHEGPVRLQLKADAGWLSAGEFISWAIRLDLMTRIDYAVAEFAINALLSDSRATIGLNISTRAICNPEFVSKIAELIQHNITVADRLWLEIPEQGAFEHLTEFRAFCSTLKTLGCKIGIEHVGAQVSRLGELHDIGIDYIKIDASIIHGIDSNIGNKA